ncbi:HTH-type transcriptional regulator NsrR [Roseibium sp. TrichSKD4]|uniref:RrF2 family transcriptional regulator n=1 Tax=Roseibium sp. TrichSKD4 TaxID=744980 RepID=UPI0001E562F8|nr:Rrf2 family transcriptional regulator [Roseibium sp. TrichSKD4]EFO34539.1 HTH-type transcriptional regulator NsrR [Roseibium sp. TrichSKD4]
MRLSQASDFALRILIYLGQTREPQTVDKLTSRLRLSKSHLMKLVAQLARLDLVETTRGRGGGILLKANPETIRIGDVVRSFETDLGVVACLKQEPTECVFLPRCALKQTMAGAADAFLDYLNQKTLADMLLGTQKIPN